MIKLLVFLVFNSYNGVTVAPSQLGTYETFGLCETAIIEYVPTIWQPSQDHFLTVYPVCYEGDFWNDAKR